MYGTRNRRRTAAGSRQRAPGHRPGATIAPRTRRGAALTARAFLPTAHRPRPTAHRLLPAARRGISLIEVLFAMGVLTVGILAMAALIPLGSSLISDANQLGGSSTLGRSAFRDLEVRGHLRPGLWVDTQAGMLIDPNTTNTFGTFGQRVLCYPYLPANCVANYLPPGTVAQPAYPVADIPAAPYQWPQPWTYSYSASNPITPPLALSVPTSPAAAVANPPPFAATDSPLIVLDPLMIAYSANTLTTKYQTSKPGAMAGAAVPPVPGSSNPPPPEWTNIQTFPYQQTYIPGAPLIPRVTLAPWPLPQFIGGTPTAPALPPLWPNPWPQTLELSNPRFMPLQVADRLFIASDDLLTIPPDPTHDRPSALLTVDPSVGPLQMEYTGDYSWFVTIAPSPQVDALSTGSTDSVRAVKSARQFAVSVVVCNSRSLELPPTTAVADPRPGEWQVQATVMGSGMSGGDVMLSAQNGIQAAWLASLRNGNWLMLNGITVNQEIRHDPNDSMNPFKLWPRFRTVANWYRIVSVDDGAGLTSTGGSRFVTVQGADWPTLDNSGAAITYVNLNTPAVPVYAYATVVQGVIGVFQKTITIDGDSPFALP